MLKVEKLSYTYPGEVLPCLENINFMIKPHSCTGIIGPSGCGKSTLLLALSGLIPHSLHGTLTGEILVNKKSLLSMSMPQISQTVQILSQNPDSQLFALNVADEVSFGLENLALPWTEIEERSAQALQDLHIQGLANRSIEELSSGQKQKVALASLLAMQPSVLLLDEPTANLDQAAMNTLVSVCQKLQKKHTLIIVEHNIEFLMQTCDQLLLMDLGKIIAQGTCTSVIASPEYKKVLLPPISISTILRKIIQLEKLPAHTPPHKKILLTVEDLQFTYANNLAALHDIHLTVKSGEFLGLLGMNGSGKSTLALNLIGLLRGKGSIRLHTLEISKEDSAKRAQTIGYVFQNPEYQLFEETVETEIGFGPQNLGLSKQEITKRVREAMHATRLFEISSRDPHSLSVGQKRRVSLASVLAMKPELLIIDEPDTGVDNKTTQQIMDYVRKLNEHGMTVILITHSLDLVARYCSRVVGMKEGRIVPIKEVVNEYDATTVKGKHEKKKGNSS